MLWDCCGSASHGNCQGDCCGLENPRCSAVVTAGLAGGASAVSSPGDSMGLLVVRLGAWVTAVLVATASELARGLHAAAGGPLGLGHWSLLWGSLLLWVTARWGWSAAASPAAMRPWQGATAAPWLPHSCARPGSALAPSKSSTTFTFSLCALQYSAQSTLYLWTKWLRGSHVGSL